MTTEEKPNLDYRHSAFSAQLIYSPDLSLISKVREAIRAKHNEHLSLNASLSDNIDKITLQSPTGSTIVTVTPSGAVLQTNYFDDFTKEIFGAKRQEYAEDKISALLGLLADAGARFSHFGMSAAAKIPIRDNNLDREKLHKAAISALNLKAPVNQDELVYDFTVRVSQKVGADHFGNVQVGWFQERRLDVRPGSQMVIQVVEWEMELINEGIEVRFDLNNKQGLFRGKRDWSKDDFIAMIHTLYELMPGSFSSVQRLISDAFAEVSK